MSTVEKNFLQLLSVANATMGGFCVPLLLWAFKDELLAAVEAFGTEDAIPTFTSELNEKNPVKLDAETFSLLGGSDWYQMFSGPGMEAERHALRRMFAEIQAGMPKSHMARLFVFNTCRDAIMAKAA
jgi:hypothetical protein